MQQEANAAIASLFIRLSAPSVMAAALFSLFHFSCPLVCLFCSRYDDRGRWVECPLLATVVQPRPRQLVRTGSYTPLVV